jgi:methylglyoxal synthase
MGNSLEKEGVEMGRLVLALIAHDAKKDDMIRLVKAHERELSGLNLVATRGTGQLIRSRVGLSVTLMGSGPLGGDQQIGSLVASDKVKAVIFLRDPLMAQPHEPDISALLRICDVYNVPLATNLATAKAVIHFLLEHHEVLGGHGMAAQFVEEMAAVHE